MSRRAAMQISRLLVGHTRIYGASKIPVSTFTNPGIIRSTPVPEFRYWSSAASKIPKKLNSGDHENADEQGGTTVVSYWGVAPPKISKADGTPWRWNSFRVRNI